MTTRIEINFTPDFWATHDGSPLVFLSAGVPERRKAQDFADCRIQEENDRFVQDGSGERIREAVTWIAGKALAGGCTLVCGGHPALAPTLLHVAMRVFADRAPASPRVLIFQSRFFEAVDIREETRVLAELGVARIIFTAVTSTTATRDFSLKDMRQAMLGNRTFCRPVPRFAAAFFIGGMYGIYEEAAMFRALQPKASTYALGYPGGAAAALLEDRVDPAWYEANPRWRRLLAAECFSSKLPKSLLSTAAYPVIVERALGVLGPRRRTH